MKTRYLGEARTWLRHVFTIAAMAMVPLSAMAVDSDGDGIDDIDDPFPADYDNYSAINNTSWGIFVLNDDDWDQALNWEDPAPSDYNNVSADNQCHWAWDTWDADWDGDSIINFYDPFPEPDTDGDGMCDYYAYHVTLLRYADPAPNDYTNYSSINGVTWYSTALDNSDGDNNFNFYDPFPYDADDDGLQDWEDPFPTDGANWSSINGESWFGNVLGNDDGDSMLNWEDPNPFVYDY